MILILCLFLIFPLLILSAIYLFFIKTSKNIMSKSVNLSVWIFLVILLSFVSGFITLQKFIPYMIVFTPTLIIAIITYIQFEKELSDDKFLFLFTMVFCSVILTVFISDIFHAKFLEIALNKFDLNHDGVFSGSEITPEQEEAMFRLTNDSYRAFLPITGSIYGFIITVLVVISANVIKLFKGKNTKIIK